VGIGSEGQGNGTLTGIGQIRITTTKTKRQYEGKAQGTARNASFLGRGRSYNRGQYSAKELIERCGQCHLTRGDVTFVVPGKPGPESKSKMAEIEQGAAIRQRNLSQTRGFWRGGKNQCRTLSLK